MTHESSWSPESFMLWWATTKRFVEHSIAFSSDSLHVLGSAIVLLGAAILLRRPLSSIRPWLVVLALTCLTEFIDLRFPQWPNPAMNWGGSTKDLVLSMALPTLFLIAARLFPRLWAPTPEMGKAVEVQGFTSDR